MGGRNDIEREQRKADWVVRIITILATLALIVAVLAGCKTKTVVVTEYRDRQVHDTTLLVDSVWRDRWHTEYLRGDTVFVRDSVFVDRYKYRDKVVEVVQRDSVPYEVVVEVEKRVRNGYDKFVSGWFWASVIILLLIVAFWVCDKIPATKPYTAMIRGLFKWLA